ncbi:unnamed protein product [Caenorhabditis auriculariae]|uniref:SHSP domain-containing protein n=1 Tax=Caenorhabditis auriculariae TaxID=2777116 RepID=A0A8S1HC65_9PELO|nr:unnamed protein product [Caenorhabditis auriculariae]
MREFERDFMDRARKNRESREFKPSNEREVVYNDKKYVMQIDVPDFRPEEIKVNLDGRKLTVEGKHESHSEHGSSNRSFSRSFMLPEDVDIDALKSSLANGKLSIEGPRIVQQSIHPIPIHINRKK